MNCEAIAHASMDLKCSDCKKVCKIDFSRNNKDSPSSNVPRESSLLGTKLVFKSLLVSDCENSFCYRCKNLCCSEAISETTQAYREERRLSEEILKVLIL